jgi:hypothetical protein
MHGSIVASAGDMVHRATGYACERHCRSCLEAALARTSSARFHALLLAA